jgi:hypothetical protein
MIRYLTKSALFVQCQRTLASSLGAIALSGGAGLAIAPTAHSATPDTAPDSLTDTLRAIDTAASTEDLMTVMQFFSADFSSPDGLTYTSLETSLSAFWERFDNLAYETELLSWEQDGVAIVAETRTVITGTESLGERDLALISTLTSQQRFVDGQIVEQEILTEETQLTSGENPPEVTVNLPDTVRPAQEFAFDAYILEPLGERYLMGQAIDEPIRPETYLDPATIELELLSAGGLFKVGRAPFLPEDQWISGVLVREDGITIVTRRLHVAGDD